MLTQSQLFLIELAQNYQSHCTECHGGGYFGSLANEDYRLCGTCNGAGSTTKIKLYGYSDNKKTATIKFLKEIEQNTEMGFVTTIPEEDFSVLLHHVVIERENGGRFN